MKISDPRQEQSVHDMKMMVNSSCDGARVMKNRCGFLGGDFDDKHGGVWLHYLFLTLLSIVDVV